MKCEGSKKDCQKSTAGFALFDYCLHCSRNLCPVCMSGKCRDRDDGGEHDPAGHGEEERVSAKATNR